MVKAKNEYIHAYSLLLSHLEEDYYSYYFLSI